MLSLYKIVVVFLPIAWLVKTTFISNPISVMILLHENFFTSGHITCCMNLIMNEIAPSLLRNPFHELLFLISISALKIIRTLKVIRRKILGLLYLNILFMWITIYVNECQVYLLRKCQVWSYINTLFRNIPCHHIEQCFNRLFNTF